MDSNHLASIVTKVPTRKQAHQAFFCSTTLYREVQPWLVKANASGPKASEMTLLRQLLARDILKKLWMIFSVSNRWKEPKAAIPRNDHDL